MSIRPRWALPLTLITAVVFVPCDRPSRPYFWPDTPGWEVTDSLCNIDRGIWIFYESYGRFPSSLSEVEARGPDGAPYMDTIPLDPWGDPFEYRKSNNWSKGFYALWSNGPDGRAWTADDAIWHRATSDSPEGR